MNVEPAPFSWPSPFVQRYESAAADAGADESAGADAEAAVLGSLDAVAAADEDGASVPPPQAVAPMATSRPSAARRFLAVITFNASSTARRALFSMAPPGRRNSRMARPRNLLPPPRSVKTVNVDFLVG
jgi:hypothetical protein